MSESRLARRVAALIDTGDKSQKEIADALGYNRPNIITMFKQGLTKVPINKAGPLAKALGADPAHMVRMAMDEYMPDALAAIEEHLGDILSAEEHKLIEAFRESTRGANPHISDVDLEKFKKWAEKLKH